MTPTALLIAAAALALNAAAGVLLPRLGLLPEPALGLRRLAAALERRLNRPQRSARDRRVRGAVVLAALAAGGAAAGLLLARLGAGSGSGRLIDLVLLALLVEQQRLFRLARAAGQALEAAGDLAPARRALAALGRDGAAALDAHGLARAAVETVALRFARGVVAPVFWYLLLGLAGLLAYAAADALRAAVAERAAFGAPARRAAAALALLPAALAGLLLALAALGVPDGRAAAALRALLRRPGGAGMVDAGWPLAAAAAALDLALLGPGPAGPAPWIGRGRARATAADLRRALLLFAIAAALLAGGLLTAGAAAVALAR